MKYLKRVVIFLVAVSSVNYADFAPSSGNGLAVHNIIQSGSGYLASSGESVLFTHPQTLEFALLGDANVQKSTRNISSKRSMHRFPEFLKKVEKWSRKKPISLFPIKTNQLVPDCVLC